jgi:hypothetical protein
MKCGVLSCFQLLKLIQRNIFLATTEGACQKSSKPLLKLRAFLTHRQYPGKNEKKTTQKVRYLAASGKGAWRISSAGK